MENQLVKVINDSGLDKTKAQVLLENFSNYFDIASDWENKAKALTVTSIEQKAEMKMAREGRLFLKERRVAVEKTRKSLKENALREGQTIDAIAKILTNLILPIEEDLEQKEKFAEIQESKRKAELKEQRETELQPLSEFVPFGLNLGEMPEEEYQKVLNGAKAQLQSKIDAERKAEEERIAKEKAAEEERKRMQAENERLKAEAEEKEKQLANERAKAESERKALEEQALKEKALGDAKLKAEREEKEKLEAELKAKKEAEEKIERDRIEREKIEEAERKKALKAPDKEKLTKWVDGIMIGLTPTVGGDAHKLACDIHVKFGAFQKWAKEQIEKL